MAPMVPHLLLRRFDGTWKHDLPTEGYVLESWSQGFLVGALAMMMGVTIANMTRILLHKLILVEVSTTVPIVQWPHSEEYSSCLRSFMARFAS